MAADIKSKLKLQGDLVFATEKSGKLLHVYGAKDSLSDVSPKDNLFAFEVRSAKDSDVVVELNFYKKEIQNLRSEKETLDDTLTRKAQEIRKNLTNDVLKAEEDMKKCYMNQKNENVKLQQQITGLKSEKTNLQQHLLDLQRRTAELEL